MTDDAEFERLFEASHEAGVIAEEKRLVMVAAMSEYNDALGKEQEARHAFTAHCERAGLYESLESRAARVRLSRSVRKVLKEPPQGG
jgi:hypothetical protein